MSFIAIGVGTAAVGVGLGATQMITSNKQQKRAQKSLEEQAKNRPL